MKRRSNSSRLPPCPKSLVASERHGEHSRGVELAQGGDVCLESRVFSSAGGGTAIVFTLFTKMIHE